MCGGAETPTTCCQGGAHGTHLPTDVSSAQAVPQQPSKPASAANLSLPSSLVMAIWFFQGQTLVRPHTATLSLNPCFSHIPP